MDFLCPIESYYACSPYYPNKKMLRRFHNSVLKSSGLLGCDAVLMFPDSWTPQQVNV